MQCTYVICLIIKKKELELKLDLGSWNTYFVFSKSLNTKGKIKVSFSCIFIGIPPLSAGSSLGSLKGSVPSEEHPCAQSGNKSNLAA